MACKVALLRASFGVEGYCVYIFLMADIKESYENTVVHLESHFERKLSQIFKRALFTRRVQAAKETCYAIYCVITRVGC